MTPPILTTLKEKAKQHRIALLLCLGIVASGVWVSLVGYSPLFVPDTQVTQAGGAASDFELTRYAYYAGIIVCGLLFIVFGNRLEFLFRKHAVPFLLVTGITMCLSTILFASAYLQTAVDVLATAMLACFISGACYNIFVFALYVNLAQTTNINVAIICIAVTLVIKLVFTAALSQLTSPFVSLLVGALIPLLVAALLCFVSRARQATSPLLEKPLLQGKERTFHILLLFAMGFGSIALKAANNVGFSVGLWGSRTTLGDLAPSLTPDGILAFLVIITSFILLCRFTLLNNTGKHIAVRYQISFLILITGCVLLAINKIVFSGSGLGFGTALFDTFDLYAHLLSWTLLISVVQTVNISYYRIIGVRTILFNVLSVIWIVAVEGNDQLIAASVIISMFVLVVGATALPLLMQLSAPAVAKADDDHYARIAAKYKLSKRETEVFVLMAQGRNRPNIQRQLQLADGTVKTHSSHIYTKLGVHSRQELLDLVVAEKAGTPR